ncbi:MAG: hypothetical protein ACREJO_18225 [Phycisphaerales bacterium]
MSRLSPKSACVLEMIAEGHSYTQIIDHYPDLVFPDIFEAAAEALSLFLHPTHDFSSGRLSTDRDDGPLSWTERMAEIKEKHPRAYAPWTAEEEDRLIQLRKLGTSTSQIAVELQRQPSAIRSRVRRLNLEGTGAGS